MKANNSILTSESLLEYERHGFFIIKGLFSIEELQPLINEGLKFSSHQARFSVKDASGNQSHLICWTDLGNDYIGVLPRLKRMVRIPKKILNKKVSHWHSKISFKNPRSKGTWDWHQDFGHWYREGCLNPDMLSIGIAISPMTEENGSLKFIKSSHKFGRIDHMATGSSNSADPEYVAEALKKYEVQPCLLDPGDAVVFHCNLLHGSGPNPTNMPRSLIICSYNALDNDPWKPIDPGHHSQEIQTLPDDKLIKGEWVSLMGESKLLNLDGADVYGYDYESESNLSNLT